MTICIGWKSSSPTEEPKQAHGGGTASWIPDNAIFKAGRELTGWFYGQPKVAHISFPSTNVRGRKSPHPPKTSPIPLDRSQSSPISIQLLPQELLQEIFHHYVHGTTKHTSTTRDVLEGSYQRIVTQRGARTTPMLLGHVCSSWRSICFSTPTLWSRVCADLAFIEDVPLFEFWLERSSTYPLDITINEELGDDDYDEGTEQLLKSALVHSSRWCKVQLNLHSDMEGLFDIDATLQSISLPLLTSVNLDLTDWTVQGCRNLSRLLSACQSLRSVEFGPGCPAAMDLCDIPWANLSSVTLGCIEQQLLLDLLPQMKALRSLAIDTLIPQSSCSSARPTITLQGLESLSLGRYLDLSPILDDLAFPSLTNLILLDGFGSSPKAGLSAIRRLIRRSSCRVRLLTWSGFGADHGTEVPQYFAEASEYLPDLTHLRITCIVGPVLVDTLTLPCSQGKSGVFPLLHSLELPKCRAPSEVIEKLVFSRPLLERFTLHLLREDHSSDLRLLETLKVHRPTLKTGVEFV